MTESKLLLPVDAPSLSGACSYQLSIVSLTGTQVNIKSMKDREKTGGEKPT